MTFNELVKKLEAAGWRLSRTGKSSSRIYVKGNAKVNVHYHGNEEVATGTANKILKQAGLK